MPVTARQHIKRMRGGANAQLLLADDGHYYVVKFRNNPQHPRILVNELICSHLLDHIGLPSPPWDVVDVPAALIEASPRMTMEFPGGIRRCEPGLHFGSRIPVNPVRQAVYDYLPVSLLRVTLNADSFAGMAAFDKWVSNANSRQAVFFRDRAKRWLEPGRTAADGQPVPPRSLVYVVNMIDHGFSFNAQRWDFSGLPEQGLYVRREVYEGVTGFESFEPWLGRIVELRADALDDAYKRIPREWYDSDFDRLEALLEKLWSRRGETPELLKNAKRAERDPFPKWNLVTRSVRLGAKG